MKTYLQKLLENQNLTKREAFFALLKIGQGEVNPAQTAAFLMGIQQKGISPEELQGFRDVMLELATKIDLSNFNAMDIVGTGGDGKDAFNISTTSALVVAGAGQKVAKHGNHGVSSLVGSSTVLEHLGYTFTNDPEILKNQLDKANFCFFHAPFFHPAMKHVGPVRKELGLKTFFNMLGPLLNPAKVNKLFLGVYDLHVFDLYEKVLSETKSQYGIVYSLDGYDEISLTSNFKLARNKERTEEISPKTLGFKLNVSQDAIKGGKTTAESAKILVDILNYQGSREQTNVVLANAGMALSVAKGIPFEEGKAMALESLESGEAFNVLKKITM